MSKRRLRPDEVELWQQIAKSAEPLVKRPAKIDPVPPKKPEPRKRESPPPMPSFALGESAPPHTETHYFPKTTSQRLNATPVQMDSKAFTRMKRGKLVPEARIDLHGMTIDQAHPTLGRFIMTSHSRGLRLVLVITGKGSREDPYDPMPRRRGVLKTQVPQWLRMPPIAQVVLQVSEAHQKHGGAGAYYVYLRRTR
ncbi:Smr/MutS family protein [Tropicibacter naphthalenivorans]|uniref:Smr domain protein n=1 Tax=Tropicibacter naphthalenivorans TaxID=441103 RepID=A0A0P1GE50_9RHOB|nr:Smr/MutS family protein [Tropicibacter naphthalenivorans]CUH79670.1 Smr domain protein [Tropicibacter naphthalenivorans]SMC74314.1 DNA-nicking endonuclease, Smr domain [Tropicibacter naphthalenivorans]